MAKHKLTHKYRPSSAQGLSRKPSSPALPTTIRGDRSDDNSEFEQQESSTDVDEEHIEEETVAGEQRAKGQKTLNKETHTMAHAATKTTVKTLVS